jgi:8-oxo-dGTP pyrophosphatase MutT (NUDIX family)
MFENDWITLGTTVKYDNPWIRVTEDQVINPSGNEGIYGLVHFKNFAVGVIPMDDDGNVYLVGQYRYALKEYSFEIPEGGGALDIDPEVSARRELLEETGFTAEKLSLILVMHLSNSVSDEKAFVYLATGLKAGLSIPEETENLTLRKYTLDEAYDMVNGHQLTDSMTVAGITKLKLMQMENLLK